MLTHESHLARIDRVKEMAKSLNSYVYHNVHSRPYSEYRHNINLFPLFPVPKTNIVNVSETSITLPESGRWFLYTIEANAFVQIKLPILTEWTSLIDYINTTGVDIRFVLKSSGKLIGRGFIYVLKNPKANNYIFAIKKDAVTRLLDGEEQFEMMSDIDVNIYYHHEGEYLNVTAYNDNSRDSYRTQFYQAIYAVSAYTKIVFIDGKEVSPYNRNGNRVLNVEDIPRNCVGEIITDSSIVGSFEIDVPSGNTTYRDANNTVKILCHIPKSFNPDNDLLNHRVCDVFVHPSPDSTDKYTNGRYLDRTNTDAQFTTITHNDFSITKSLPDTYAQLFLDTTGYTIKVFVRNHHKGFKLGKESQHVASLYRLTDEKILSYLLGKESVTYWTAANLEASKWAYLMDNYLEGVTTSSFDMLVSALGYNASANAICQRVIPVLVSQELSRRFYIPIPICYLEQDDLICHVFREGKRLSEDYFTFERDHQFLIVTLQGDIALRVGEYLIFELFEATPYRCRTLELAVGASATLEINQNYTVYHVYPVSSTNAVVSHAIYQRFTLANSYKEFTEQEKAAFISTVEQADGTTLVTITNRTTEAMPLLVASTDAYQKILGVEMHLKEFNYDILCSHLLRVKAKLFPFVTAGDVEDVDGQIQTIPYLNTNKSTLVYLNGRELTKGLDYQEYVIRTVRNYLCGQFVVVQNVDYLQSTSNALEVFSINEDVATLDYGFLTKNRTETVKSHLAYFDNIGMFFADGCYAKDVTDDYYASNISARPGASYKTRTLVPQCLKSVLTEYGSENNDRDDDVIQLVESQLPVETEVAPIVRSHHLYSVYLQKIVEDVLRGVFKPRMDWSDERLTRELRAYDDYLEFDLSKPSLNAAITSAEEAIHPPEKGLDYRFVDVLPSYRTELLEDSDLTITDERPIMVITGSAIDEVNGNYICINPGVEYMKDTSPRHINENAYKQWSNMNSHCRITHLNGYWKLVDINERECYRARDTIGVKDIWNLQWEAVAVGAGNIHIDTTVLEINTSNEFRIHRLSFTQKIEEYNVLMRIARMSLKQDLVKDGMNI